MNKLLKSALLLAAAVLSWSAQAQSGSVALNGSVSSATCTSTPSATTVTLPSVSSSSLAIAGATAGATSWTISLSACTGTPATMRTYFEQTANINASGRIRNATGTATNVDVQVLNSSGGVVNLAAAAGLQNIATANIVGNAASQTFYLRYYATGATTSGTFASSLSWTILYT